MGKLRKIIRSLDNPVLNDKNYICRVQKRIKKKIVIENNEAKIIEVETTKMILNPSTPFFSDGNNKIKGFRRIYLQLGSKPLYNKRGKQIRPNAKIVLNKTGAMLIKEGAFKELKDLAGKIKPIYLKAIPQMKGVG